MVYKLINKFNKSLLDLAGSDFNSGLLVIDTYFLREAL